MGAPVCCHCFRSLGPLKSGKVRRSIAVVRPDGRIFTYCKDTPVCAAAAGSMAMLNQGEQCPPSD